MEPWTLLVILLAWIAIVLAPAAKLGYENALNPDEEQKGASIFPGIPVMPLLVIGVMYLAKWIFGGTAVWVFFWVHLFFLCTAVYVIVYWTWKLKSLR